MKRVLLTTTAVLFAVVSVHADLNGSFKTITLDGSLADWSNPADVLYDSLEVTVGGAYDDLYLANDAANLYIAMDTSAPGGGDINNGYLHNIYIDTDSNPATGFNSGWMANGYDRLIQYGGTGTSVYEFTGGTQAAWGWGWLSVNGFGYNDEIAELAISTAALGVVGGDDIKVTFNVNPGVDTWAPAWEGASETYTVAIPEPGTASLMAVVGGAVLFIRRKLMS